MSALNSQGRRTTPNLLGLGETAVILETGRAELSGITGAKGLAA